MNTKIISLNAGQVIRLPVGNTVVLPVGATYYISKKVDIEVFEGGGETGASRFVDCERKTENIGFDMPKVIATSGNEHIWKSTDTKDAAEMSCECCGVTRTPQEDLSFCHSKLLEVVKQNQNVTNTN
jgi:hypothetical protein